MPQSTVLLFIVALGQPFPTLLEWKVVTKKFPWNIVLLLGAGFAMAKAAKVLEGSCVVSFSFSNLDSLFYL